MSRKGRRVYPYHATLAHVVGYASGRYGTAGIEDAFDRELAARPLTSGPVEQVQALLAPARNARRGDDIVTTIDTTVQDALTAALSRYERGAGVVIDPRSGAVLALASVPSFDPNSLDAIFPKLAHDASSPLLDRSTLGLYPPGSTFKIVTAADALDAGTVTPADSWYDPGTFTVGDFTVHDNEGESTGTQDLTGAFKLSSNVDFAQIGLKLGLDRWYDYAGRWRLGESLDFDLPTARDGIPSRASVSPSILAQMSFGQGALLVTPLQMALVASTIAADGVIPRPFIVRQIAGAATKLATQPEQLATPISATVAHQVRSMMVAVVQSGTGTAAALPAITVAGKTGTATNPAGTAHAWFVAFAPAEKPRVAVAVLVENGGYGGTVSAPIARDVLRVALSKTGR